ncbi:Wzy polymerase domain-containing protein [Paludibacterium denitrificans]|uniref:Wzy polymerase domain-containing protein n=1 Tax=Paludibacterium denitrificans TaxID=2675226 RepID=UPI002477CEC2|nr:Wzy polymerase domain-containing protein [Paludibacterium denitrificans]
MPLLALLLAIGWLSVSGTSMFWELVGLYSQTGNVQQDAKRQARLAQIVQQQPLFAYHALNTLDDYLVVDRHDVQQKLAWEQRLTAFRPYPDVMLKQAQLQAFAGQRQAAEQTLRTTLASFPTYASQFLDSLDEDEPARQPLRDIAQQTYDKLYYQVSERRISYALWLDSTKNAP